MHPMPPKQPARNSHPTPQKLPETRANTAMQAMLVLFGWGNLSCGWPNVRARMSAVIALCLSLSCLCIT